MNKPVVNILKTIGAAIAGAVLTIIYTSFKAGVFNLDFDAIWKAAALVACVQLVRIFVPNIEVDETPPIYVPPTNQESANRRL